MIESETNAGLAAGQTWKRKSDGKMVTLGERVLLDSTRPQRGFYLGPGERTGEDFMDFYDLVAPSPAANVERRAGQRYSLWKQTYELVNIVPVGEMYAGEWRAKVRPFDSDCILSEENLCEGILISDAPAAPAKVCGDCRAEVCICDVLASHAPPAQEAPKVRRCIDDDVGRCGGVMESRFFRSKVVDMCVAHWLIRESGVAGEMIQDGLHTFNTGVLRDHAIPSRLPRPALACDDVWDLLPDANR